MEEPYQQYKEGPTVEKIELTRVHHGIPKRSNLWERSEVWVHNMWWPKERPGTSLLHVEVPPTSIPTISIIATTLLITAIAIIAVMRPRTTTIVPPPVATIASMVVTTIVCLWSQSKSPGTMVQTGSSLILSREFWGCLGCLDGQVNLRQWCWSRWWWGQCRFTNGKGTISTTATLIHWLMAFRCHMVWGWRWIQVRLRGQRWIRVRLWWSSWNCRLLSTI